MDEDLKRLLDTMQQENAAAHDQTRRHFEIIAEGLRRELQIVAEGVTLNGEKIDQVDRRSIRSKASILA